MWHVEVLDLNRDCFLKVVPDLLNNEQLVKLKEMCIRNGYVLIIEYVEREAIL